MSELLNQNDNSEETEQFQYFQMGRMQSRLEEMLELRRVEAEPNLASAALRSVIEKPQA